MTLLEFDLVNLISFLWRNKQAYHHKKEHLKLGKDPRLSHQLKLKTPPQQQLRVSSLSSYVPSTV
eukprot:857136-Pelagomonas_calceolata.AAC.1